MVDFAIGYLLIGVLVTAWFIRDCIRSRRKVNRGEGNTTDQLVVNMSPLLKTGFAVGLIPLWPIGLFMLIRAGKDTPNQHTDEDPQDRVPPEYR